MDSYEQYSIMYFIQAQSRGDLSLRTRHTGAWMYRLFALREAIVVEK